MVHIRINERDSNPNSHINFVSVLPMVDATLEDNARQLIRALAAQVKPVMKAHGFTVNSLEEVCIRLLSLSPSWISTLCSTSTTECLQGGTGTMGRRLVRTLRESPLESSTEHISAELVLKSASGSFVPVHWLMSTLCHEVSTLHDLRNRLIDATRRV